MGEVNSEIVRLVRGLGTPYGVEKISMGEHPSDVAEMRQIKCAEVDFLRFFNVNALPFYYPARRSVAGWFH